MKYQEQLLELKDAIEAYLTGAAIQWCLPEDGDFPKWRDTKELIPAIRMRYRRKPEDEPEAAPADEPEAATAGKPGKV